MRKFLAIGVAVVLVLATACAPAGKSLNGTWDVTGMKDMPPGATATMTFSGTDAIEMVMTMEIPPKGTATFKVSGTYKLEGEKMTVNFTKADSSLSGADEMITKAFETGKAKTEADLVAQLQKDNTSNVKWIDDNTVEFTTGTSTATLKKKA